MRKLITILLVTTCINSVVAQDVKIKKGEILVGGYNIVPSGDIKHVWEDIKLEAPFHYNLK